MTKQISLYQIREYVGSNYSKQLGRRLRTRQQATRVCKLLKKQGRQVFAARMTIAA